jgi:hypothetical protein
MMLSEDELDRIRERHHLQGGDIGTLDSGRLLTHMDELQHRLELAEAVIEKGWCPRDNDTGHEYLLAYQAWQAAVSAQEGE